MVKKMVSARSRGSGRKADPEKANGHDLVRQKVNKKVESEAAIGRPRREVKKTEKAKLLEEEKVERAAKKVENSLTPRVPSSSKIEDAPSSGGPTKTKGKGPPGTPLARTKTPLAIARQVGDVTKPNVTALRGRRRLGKQLEPVEQVQPAQAAETPALETAGEAENAPKSRGRKKKEVGGSEPGPKRPPSSAAVAKRCVRRVARSETPKMRKDSFGVSEKPEPEPKKAEPVPEDKSVSSLSAKADSEQSSFKNVSTRKGRAAKKASPSTTRVAVEEGKTKPASATRASERASKTPKTPQPEKEPASVPKRGRPLKKKSSTAAGSNRYSIDLGQTLVICSCHLFDNPALGHELQLSLSLSFLTDFQLSPFRF